MRRVVFLSSTGKDLAKYRRAVIDTWPDSTIFSATLKNISAHGMRLRSHSARNGCGAPISMSG